MSITSPLAAFALFLGTAPATSAQGPASADDVPQSGGARWGADYFPNVSLTTHEGRTVRFFDDLIRGKVVVINFIYTSCPDACPLETAKLGEVQALLGERMGQDVFFYSISIDPARDTPEVLEAYHERFQTGPGWLFLTGAAADIKLIRQKLGMIASDEESLKDHTLSLLIGNQATGQWMKRSPFENPYFLSEQIGSWLSNWKRAPEPGNDYADAPALRSVSRGESLFRTRCSACHLLGAEDGIVRQGPNLLGVTERRERPWLARWLAEPDAMLAEKDPLALELSQTYRNLPMPNMRLNPLEVDALLEYMAEESSWFTGGTAEEPDSLESAAAPCCQKRAGLVLGDEGGAAVAAATSDAESVGPTLALEPMTWPSLPATTTVGGPRSPRVALWLGAGLALALGCLGSVLARRDQS